MNIEDVTIATNYIDLLVEKITRSFVPENVSWITKKENSKYIRKCEQCHGEYEVFGTRWKGYGGRKARKFCSKECADLNRIGKYTDENSAQWKGGVTSLQDVVRKCANYTRLRKACFERDNYHSILSGETGILNHHHLTAYSILFNKYKITKDNWRELNHILFDIKNVVTLTVKEHKKFHSIYGKVTTEEQFEEFRNNYLGGI